METSDDDNGGVIETKSDPHIDGPIVFDDLPPFKWHYDTVNSMMVEFWHGGLIGDDERLYFDAHTHLQVVGQLLVRQL